MEEKPKDTKLSDDKIPALHTYAGDMATMVREYEGSVIKIALAEQKRREEETQKVKTIQKKRVGVFLFILGIILIAASIYGVIISFEQSKKNAVHEEMGFLPTPIPTDDQIIVNTENITGKEDLKNLFKNSRTTPSPEGQVRALFFVKGAVPNQRIISTNEFLDLELSSMPSNMRENLKEEFMVGFYNEKGVTHTFFIFQINDYDKAYAGALAWEKTLLDEFFLIFNIDVLGDNKILLEKPFEDILVNNKNMRVLTDTKEKPILYSVFLNQNLYMLTDNEQAINEVAKRLRTINTRPL